MAEGRFKFLNEERSCDSPGDWAAPGADKLWVYHLHYFDDLNARGASDRSHWHRRILARWIREYRPGHRDGWDPYPTSLRLVNWIKWALSGHEVFPSFVESLALQVRWLDRRLEFHLLGNHLLANAKALIFAGLYFSGTEADRWFSRGTKILVRQLEEQILDDGGHFELSPMYHSLVLEDILDTLNVLSSYERLGDYFWKDTVSRMRRWLGVMCHPDRQISFFNDTAIDACPSLDEIDSYAERLGLSTPSNETGRLEVLGASGYVRACAPDAYLICDCAAVGPDYLPGHGHADTLSFELSLFGQRVFVNSGTSKYGTGAERHRQRGTAAHNTVTVNGVNSSEVWGGFRLARRARASLNRVEFDGVETRIHGEHDGYRRLAGRNIHQRIWQLRNGELEIEDRVSGKVRSASAFLHLHPAVKASDRQSGRIELRWPGASATIETEGSENVQIEEGSWHPRFGENVPNTRLVVTLSGPTLRTYIRWRLD